MEYNKDQGGAAVRGEAVAVSHDLTTHRDAWRDAITTMINDEAKACNHDQADYWRHELKAYDRAFDGLLDATVSPRAADAPSEPSEPLLSMAQVNAIRDTIKPGDGWDGDNWDFALANAVAAKVKSRAADALDSQSTSSTGAEAIFPPELPKFMPDFPFGSNEELWDHAILTGWRAGAHADLRETLAELASVQRKLIEANAVIANYQVNHPQPVIQSIGEDAQFCILLANCKLASKNGTSLLDVAGSLHAQSELVAYIDSRASSAPVAAIVPDGWQPIETAPTVKGDYFFCSIAWGPEGDQSTGHGMRWNGRWFAAPVFHALGQERKYEHREIEVKPTHWRRSTPAPQQEGSEAGNG